MTPREDNHATGAVIIALGSLVEYEDDERQTDVTAKKNVDSELGSRREAEGTGCQCVAPGPAGGWCWPLRPSVPDKVWGRVVNGSLAKNEPLPQADR